MRRKTDLLILAFIIGAALMLSYCEAKAETSMHISPVLAVGGKFGKDSFQIAMTEHFGRYEVELTLTQFDRRMYNSVTARRVIGDGPFHLLFGGTWWPNWSPGTGANFTFDLGMRYRFNERWAIEYNHNSDAGSNDNYNDGLDVLSVRYFF